MISSLNMHKNVKRNGKNGLQYFLFFKKTKYKSSELDSLWILCLKNYKMVPTCKVYLRLHNSNGIWIQIHSILFFLIHNVQTCLWKFNFIDFETLIIFLFHKILKFLLTTVFQGWVLQCMRMHQNDVIFSLFDFFLMIDDWWWWFITLSKSTIQT